MTVAAVSLNRRDGSSPPPLSPLLLPLAFSLQPPYSVSRQLGRLRLQVCFFSVGVPGPAIFFFGLGDWEQQLLQLPAAPQVLSLLALLVLKYE